VDPDVVERREAHRWAQSSWIAVSLRHARADGDPRLGRGGDHRHGAAHCLEFRSTRGFEHRGRWALEVRDGQTCVSFRIDYKLSALESLLLHAAGLPQFLTRHVEGSIEALKRALARDKP